LIFLSWQFSSLYPLNDSNLSLPSCSWRFSILTDVDVKLFHWIYNLVQSGISHELSEYVSNPRNFIVSGVLCILSLIIFEKRRGLVLIIVLASGVALNDAICHKLLKPMVARPRPCQTIDLNKPGLRCSHNYSFPSNHAGNSFTAATMLSLRFPLVSIPAYGLALAVGFSRIHLGLHYPLDILGGAIFGGFMGWVFFYLYRRTISAAQL